MFVRYFVEIPMSSAELEAAILAGPKAWIPDLARDADERGEQLLLEVGFGASARRVDRRVEITIGEPMRGFGRTLDRALLHRVAEATVKDFLDRVGAKLQAVAALTAYAG